MRKMGVGLKLVFQPILLLLLFSLVYCSLDMVDIEQDILKSQIYSDRNVNTTIMDAFSYDNSGKKGGISRVSVYTVALFTIAMASVTGLGAIPFFFMQLDPQLSGICNGMAAGVMLAASFDLIQEGQEHGNGSWVAAGIIGGGVFILLCKKLIEQYGEVSMLDIKGADAAKVVLVIGIMTLHSFGEGSGVGVSFAGSKGLSQGALVTLAIAVHNIPEGLAVSMVLASKGVSPQNAMLWSVITSLPQPIVAVPSFIFAESFDKFLPFCTGFAAGCMIWMVTAEVLPDAFKEASPTQIASATTLSVAFMEALSSLFKTLNHSQPDAYGLLSYLLFGVGPLLGGTTVVAFALTFHLQHAFLTGLSSGIAFFLSTWRPLQLLLSSKISLFSLLFLLTFGALSTHFLTSAVLRIMAPKRMSSTTLSSTDTFKMSVPTLRSFMACVVAACHAFVEGLGLRTVVSEHQMVVNACLHGLPEGAAVAGCVLSVTDSWFWAVAAAVVVGWVRPITAKGASMLGMESMWLPYVTILACGSLFSGFYEAVRRAVRVERKRSSFGLVLGFTFCCFWMCTTNLVFDI